jgi:two-component system CheB/CheR fusion protein
VRLPIAGEEERASEADTRSAPQPGPSRGRRILIVDDNLDAAETLAMMLEILGQETRQAHDGREALAVAGEYKPDLVFMDIGLPGISGLEACERMRGELGMRDAYLVAVSGYGTEEDRRKSRAAGFDDHVVKPLDPAMLPQILSGARRAQPAG